MNNIQIGGLEIVGPEIQVSEENGSLVADVDWIEVRVNGLAINCYNHDQIELLILGA